MGKAGLWGAALVVAILSVATVAAAAAPTTPPSGPTFMDMGEMLKRATIVARVHLVSRVPVGTRPSNDETWQPALNEEPACGYLYHAIIVDPIKGGGSSLDFFSAVSDDFSGFDHDYLIFVFERGADRRLLNLRDVSNLTLGDAEAREINCLISQRYYVGRLQQTMFSFDAKASKILGGEWLDPPNRLPACWPLYSSLVAKPDEKRLFNDPLIDGQAQDYGLLSWRALHAALNNYFTDRPSRRFPVRSWAETKRVIQDNLGAGPYLLC